jgi:hypothetical protein
MASLERLEEFTIVHYAQRYQDGGIDRYIDAEVEMFFPLLDVQISEEKILPNLRSFVFVHGYETDSRIYSDHDPLHRSGPPIALPPTFLPMLEYRRYGGLHGEEVRQIETVKFIVSFQLQLEDDDLLRLVNLREEGLEVAVWQKARWYESGVRWPGVEGVERWESVV